MPDEESVENDDEHAEVIEHPRDRNGEANTMRFAKMIASRAVSQTGMRQSRFRGENSQWFPHMFKQRPMRQWHRGKGVLERKQGS